MSLGRVSCFKIDDNLVIQHCIHENGRTSRYHLCNEVDSTPFQLQPKAAPAISGGGGGGDMMAQLQAKLNKRY